MLGGLFGVFSQRHLARDLFFGIDYHSHLGTDIGGLAFINNDLTLITHNISNSQFKAEFQEEYTKISGALGIGVLSDSPQEQPIKIESKIGTFALCTIGFVRNTNTVYNQLINEGATFKNSDSSDKEKLPNQTEVVGELISRGQNIVDGIEKMYQTIDGSISLLLLSENEKRIYASGDTFPLIASRRGDDLALASETSAVLNLGYEVFKFLEYREIISIGISGIKTRINITGKKKFCPFLHIYFGFPTSDYYGINAEVARERCGGFLAETDEIETDMVLGIADSGFPHSVGYVKRKIELTKETITSAFETFKQGKIDITELEQTVKNSLRLVSPLRRPLVKYTPGWGRSYIPPTAEKRELIAKYKQIPNPQIIKDKRIILVDDSIRRGTQLQDLLKEKLWPYEPKEIHGRIASPPQMYPCIYDLSTKTKDLATYKAIPKLEEEIDEYLRPTSSKYKVMVEKIRQLIGFTTLKFQSLDNLVKAVIEAPNNKDLKKDDLCLYCWTGRTLHAVENVG